MSPNLTNKVVYGGTQVHTDTQTLSHDCKVKHPWLNNISMDLHMFSDEAVKSHKTDNSTTEDKI